MKISIVSPGVIQDGYLRDGIAIFEKRIRRYNAFEMIWLSEPKNMKNQPESVQKAAEGKLILAALQKVDYPVLLDVSGKQLSSEDFSGFLQQCMNKGSKHLCFVIGGPFGFSEEVYRVVPERISLSSMTFTHQIIRLIFLEQLYRAFTIIRNEPYHHA